MPSKEDKTPRKIVFQSKPAVEKYDPEHSDKSMKRCPVLVLIQKRPGKLENGTEQEGCYYELRANSAFQYVLPEQAPYWDECYAAMKKYKKAYGLIEVGEEEEGVLPVVERKNDTSEEVLKENASLKARIAALEAKVSEDRSEVLAEEKKAVEAKLQAVQAELSSKKK